MNINQRQNVTPLMHVENRQWTLRSIKMMARYQDSDSNDMVTTDLITNAKALKS